MVAVNAPRARSTVRAVDIDLAHEQLLTGGELTEDGTAGQFNVHLHGESPLEIQEDQRGQS